MLWRVERRDVSWIVVEAKDEAEAKTLAEANPQDWEFVEGDTEVTPED